MMAKWFVPALLTAFFTGGDANATIARLAVMGTQPVFGTGADGSGVVANSVNGSLWYDDDYNVFYNPAYVNDNKNYAVVQKGFEGGFFKSFLENFAYGVYFNRGHGQGGAPQTQYAPGLVSPGVNQIATFSGTVGTALDTQRPIDVFIGGDTGVKWGLHGIWAYNRNQATATNPGNESGEVIARYWHVRFGLEVVGFEPFLGATVFSHYDNTNKSSTTTQSLDEFNAGFRYKYEGWTLPYFVFKKYREGGFPIGQDTGAGNNPQRQTRLNIWGLGFAHDTKVADGVHVHKAISGWISSVVDDVPTKIFAPVESDHKFQQTVIPLQVALEAEATSWLTLRAGVTYDLINERKNERSNAKDENNVSDKKVSQAGATTFRVGSTLKFGKLHLDSAFGTGQTDAGGLTNATQLDEAHVGFDAQIFAILSASYHW